LVKSNPSALARAAAVSAAVYKEQGAGPDYWEKYYKGAEEKDKQGQTVDLGGSSVSNLADSLLTFGLVPGSANLFAATYKVFGDIVVAQYPELVPNYPGVSEILDTSYLQAVARRAAPTARVIATTKPHYERKQTVHSVVSRR